MIEDKLKQFEEPVFGHFGFSDGSSGLNNHSAMTVSKFIRALSDEFKSGFVSKLFSF